MATHEENRILQHIALEGSITRLERDLIGISADLFADIIGSLKFRGWIDSTEQVRKSDSGRDMIIYKYTFTPLFENQKDSYLKYINPEI